MLQNLSEPNETRLGVSSGKPQGRGVSGKQARDLYKSIVSSQAAKSGLVNEISECDLFINGVGPDKMSDMTTNIIREYLIDYTQQQCELHDIPMRNVPSGPLWDSRLGLWREHYKLLPTYKGKRLLLIPKVFVRRRLCMNSQEYLNEHVLDFLQAEHLKAGSGLVEVLKNGTARVTKKALKSHYPCTKEWMAQFSIEHQDVLKGYKELRQKIAKRERKAEADALNDGLDERTFASALIEKLQSIPPGNEQASLFHNVMKGIVEFLFWPNLTNPVKEQEINEGRKRIDIMYDNSAQEGFFHRILSAPQMRALKLPVEFKNYTKDPANPEIDQLAGRFAPNRGNVGILLYRSTEKYSLLVQRCRDSAIEGRGIILPLGDQQIFDMLNDVAEGKRDNIDRRLGNLLDRMIC